MRTRSRSRSRWTRPGWCSCAATAASAPTPTRSTPRSRRASTSRTPAASSTTSRCPKENVWIDGNLAVYNQVMAPSSWWPNIMQQTTIRGPRRSWSSPTACSTGWPRPSTTLRADLEMLGEVLELRRDHPQRPPARRGATPRPGRAAACTRRPGRCHPMRSLLPEWFTRINEIIKTIGSHNLLAAASRAPTRRPPPQRPDRTSSSRVPTAMTAEERTRRCTGRRGTSSGSLLGSRNELYERNYLMSARSNRMVSSGSIRQRLSDTVTN